MSSEIINLNNTTPAAPSHTVNVQWQKGAQSGTDPQTGAPIYPASANVPAATTSALGVVQPDGSTVDVSGAGVISVPTATVSQLGLVKPDGTTITISGGVISASGSGGGGSVPTLASMGLTTALNQRGSFSASNVYNGVLYQDTTSNSGDWCEGNVMAYPATPFTASMLISVDIFNNTFGNCTFAALTSLTGKMITWGYQQHPYFGFFDWNTPTSYNGDPFETAPPLSLAEWWFQWKDDGTSIYVSVSSDGTNWHQQYTVTKAASFLGASGFNYFGVIVSPNGSSIGMTVKQWKITNP